MKKTLAIFFSALIGASMMMDMVYAMPEVTKTCVEKEGNREKQLNLLKFIQEIKSYIATGRFIFNEERRESDTDKFDAKNGLIAKSFQEVAHAYANEIDRRLASGEEVGFCCRAFNSWVLVKLQDMGIDAQPLGTYFQDGGHHMAVLIPPLTEGADNQWHVCDLSLAVQNNNTSVLYKKWEDYILALTDFVAARVDNKYSERFFDNNDFRNLFAYFATNNKKPRSLEQVFWMLFKKHHFVGNLEGSVHIKKDRPIIDALWWRSREKFQGVKIPGIG